LSPVRIPVSGSMHRLFNYPVNNCNPAIPKIIKKNIKMMIESFNKGIALNSAVRSYFKALIFVMDFNGLNTLRDLNADRLKLDPEIIYGRYPVTIITISTIFQGSLM